MVQVPAGQDVVTATVCVVIGIPATYTTTLSFVTSKATLVFPTTSIVTSVPIFGGYGVTSTAVTVPDDPAQSLKSIVYSKAFTN